MFVNAGDRAGRRRGSGPFLISEAIAHGSPTSITFGGIPKTYRDLIIRVRGRTTVAAGNVQCFLQFNGDTGANYTTEINRAYNATFVGAQANSQTSGIFGELTGTTATANYVGGIEIIVFDYRNTTYFKTWLGKWVNTFANSGSACGNGFESGLWSNTSAINSVKLFPSSLSFANESVFSIYGSY